MTSRFDHTPTKTERARRLRKEATASERLLWSRLRSAQMDGVSFRRQHPMGPYVLDFFCPSLGIVIELDGDQHGFDKQAKRDRRRDDWLIARGLRVLRFWNSEIRENLDGVLDSIFLAVDTARRGDPLPSSLFQGEGTRVEPVEQDQQWSGDSGGDATSPPPERERLGGGQDQANPIGETPTKASPLHLHPANAEMRDEIRSTHAVRLGFRQIKGFREEDATALVGARGKGYDSVRDLWLRSGLTRAAIERLADADAFRSLGLDRRDALWAARELGSGKANDRLPLFDVAEHADIRREPDFALPPMPVGEHVVNDYRYLSLSLKAHPVSFIRPGLAARGIIASEALRKTRNGRRVSVSGLAIVRQRPGTASGVIFMTIEDETDIANIVVWPKVFEKFRSVVLGARFVAVTGKVQSESGVIHVIADRLEDLTHMLADLSAEPDLKPAPGEAIDPWARAYEIRHPGQDNRERAEHRAGIRHPRTVRFFENGPASSEIARATGAAMPKGRNFH